MKQQSKIHNALHDPFLFLVRQASPPNAWPQIPHPFYSPLSLFTALSFPLPLFTIHEFSPPSLSLFILYLSLPLTHYPLSPPAPSFFFSLSYLSIFITFPLPFLRSPLFSPFTSPSFNFPDLLFLSCPLSLSTLLRPTSNSRLRKNTPVKNVTATVNIRDDKSFPILHELQRI